MKYLYIIKANIFRHKMRVIFTILSVAVAFLIFGLMMATNNTLSAGINLAGIDRLLVMNKTSLIQPLPIRYLSVISNIGGVSQVSHATWFGGYINDPRQIIPVFAVKAESYLDIYSEIKIQDRQKLLWFNNKTGALVGKEIADRFGIKEGDKIRLQSSIWKNRDGNSTWYLTVSGIYTGKEKEYDSGSILFHYKLLNESRTFHIDSVGWYIVTITNPDNSADIALNIDKKFENSTAETKTSTEKAFVQNFVNQFGDIGTIVNWISLVVFFSMSLVTANTMAQSFRERINEFAVMKVMGFTDKKFISFMIIESLIITSTGGLIGILLALIFVSGLKSSIGQFLPGFSLSSYFIFTTLALIFVFSILAALIPSVQIIRIKVVNALRSL